MLTFVSTHRHTATLPHRSPSTRERHIHKWENDRASERRHTQKKLNKSQPSIYKI